MEQCQGAAERGVRALSEYLDKYKPATNSEAVPEQPRSFLDKYAPAGVIHEAAEDMGPRYAPGTTKEQAANVPPEMVFNPKTGGYVDTALRAENKGKLFGATAEFVSGAPFVGEYINEATGSLIQEETVTQAREQFRESNPKTSLAAGITGGVMASTPLAGGAGVLTKVPGLVPKLLVALGIGGVAGGAEGVVSGYGRGRNDAERRQNAKRDGLIMGGAGATLGPAGVLAGKGATAIYKQVAKMDVTTIAKELGVSKRAADIIKRHLANDDLGGAKDALDRLGPDAMLADAGPGTAQAVDTMTQMGGSALKTGKEAVLGRSNKIAKELTPVLDDVLGSPVGVKKAANDISKRTARVRRAAYNRAYTTPIDYASGAGRGIEGVLERVPPNTLQRAVQEANDAMRAEGIKNQQIIARIADDGAVSFGEMPNVQQLDELKKALGKVAREDVDQFGRRTASGNRAAKLAGDLKNAISDAVPSYQTAVRLGGDKIAEDNALDMGRKLLTESLTVEDVRNAMRGASKEARQSAKMGLRENIEEAMSRVKRTITDPDTDAREAMKIVKDFSSRKNTTKMRLVLGESGANKLLKELDRQAAALDLKSVIANNSKTAIRTAGKDAFDAATSPGILLSAKRGEGGQAAKKIVQSLMGAGDDALEADRDAVANEVVKALTGIKGADAQRALAIVQDAMNGQPVKEAEAQFVSKVATSPIVLGGYLSTSQSLTSP